jgi:serine/threonine-protein kinase HipA
MAACRSWAVDDAANSSDDSKPAADRGGPREAYASDWIGLRGAFPISTTMPLKSERIASDTFLPWAANLLPGSEQLRTLGQLLGSIVREDGVWAILVSIGQHCRK